MMGMGRTKQFIEKMYLAYDKNFDVLLELILSGKFPEEETEIKITIEKTAGVKEKQAERMSTTYNEI